ncbi:MAG TPA: 16S rRNA (guanine(966)-N(2))-methyltransferase RsmD [Clostridium sp.]|nr:16S rRNA (guanine(966)-N(2))-methyltransferase RsmD [Clostridium sp.]
MRIISGNWKGHRVKTVKGLLTRPTSAKVKEAIFNILGSKVKNAKVLDLFAGTGNLSWEALSRGADAAVLVEKSNRAWEIAKENLDTLGFEDRSKVLKMDVLSFLHQNRREIFDLIFLDPPYHQGLVNRVLSILKNNSLLEPNGVIIIETASDEKILEDIFPLEIMISKEYGDTKIWFLQEAEEQGEG